MRNLNLRIFTTKYVLYWFYKMKLNEALEIDLHVIKKRILFIYVWF